MASGTTVPPRGTAAQKRGARSKGRTWTQSGTTRVVRAILPLRSGTTACCTRAVLPLWPAVLPLGPNEAHMKGNELSIEAERLRGCEKDVYVLIPP